MRIHTYFSDSGTLTHYVADGENYGGEIGVTGETLPLTGCATPAMRQATEGTPHADFSNPHYLGDGRATCAYYVGTDKKGRIVRA